MNFLARLGGRWSAEASWIEVNWHRRTRWCRRRPRCAALPFDVGTGTAVEEATAGDSIVRRIQVIVFPFYDYVLIELYCKL